jgi:TIR domain
MPLDEIGRRYADSFYQRRLHELPDEEQEIGALRNRHASRGSVLSGNYINELGQLLLRRVDALAQSKAEGLVTAYEKSGLPFDETAFQDSKREIVDFCHSQQHNLIGSMTPIVRQTFGANTPAGTFDALSKGIISGIDAIIGRLTCDLAIKRDGELLEDRKQKQAYAAGLGKKWDAFICHASEDKNDFVDPFARGLRDSGLSVWYDVFSLKVGDSLRRKIDEGLTKSRYGIVVLSKHFFCKEWPQNELDGLMSRDIAGTKVILPIWHNITVEEVRAKSPILAGRVAAKSEHGLKTVISEIRDAMGISDPGTVENASANQATRKPELRIHAYEKSCFTLVTKMNDRGQLAGMHVNLDMALENRGSKGKTVHRYNLHIRETHKTYPNIHPNLDLVDIRGRHCVRDIGNEPRVTRDGLIRVPADTTCERGFLPFFPLDAPIQISGPVHCTLTVTDTNDESVSQDFELHEV